MAHAIKNEMTIMQLNPTKSNNITHEYTQHEYFIVGTTIL